MLIDGIVLKMLLKVNKLRLEAELNQCQLFHLGAAECMAL